MTRDNDGMQPLAGYRIGVTAARKVDEQRQLLERRGATVTWAPALSTDPNHIDEAALRASTTEVLDRPIDLFLATTGIGMRTWFAAVESWGWLDQLTGALARAELLARGPKSVGALRRRGLRENWSAESEELQEMLDYLAGRDLTGTRIVVQEHGQSLSTVAETLRSRGADVTTVAIYRIAPADDPAPLHRLLASIAERRLDAVTFTSAPAVAAVIEAAGVIGRRDEVFDALRDRVLAACVGPVTAAAFDGWDVPSVYPERSRLAAMVRQLEVVLPSRRGGSSC